MYNMRALNIPEHIVGKVEFYEGDSKETVPKLEVESANFADSTITPTLHAVPKNSAI